MGCDIHVYVESRPDPATAWTPFGGRINPGRDYRLFNLIAGVRADEDSPAPLFTLRGLPEGLSYYAQEDYDEASSDWHSMTWITADELARCIRVMPRRPHPNYYALVASMWALEGCGLQVRAVIWFDN